MFLTDRAQRPNSRRAMMVAGVATIAVSLVVSIAPAMAAKGGNGNANGNAGVAKIHDATTDVEAGETANEPWVCTFWVGFSAPDANQTGAWEILSWPPTGDGSVVTSGTYQATGDEMDATGDLSLADGHYRLNWQATGDSNAKHKTFWVDCGPTESNSDPTDEAAPTEEVAPTDEADPSGEEQGIPGDETPPTDGSQPSGDPAPTDEASHDQQENPDATDEASPTPEEGVLAGNPSPDATPPASEGDAAAVGGGASELPDTSLPVQPSGVLATIGVLLIIAAHLGTRRARSLPTA